MCPKKSVLGKEDVITAPNKWKLYWLPFECYHTGTVNIKQSHNFCLASQVTYPIHNLTLVILVLHIETVCLITAQQKCYNAYLHVALVSDLYQLRVLLCLALSNAFFP